MTKKVKKSLGKLTKNLKSFTLIELIIVIAIIAILSTVATMTLQGWFAKSRDAARKGNLSTMSKALEMSFSKRTTLPMPDNSIEVTAEGEAIGYQGDFGSGVVNNLPDLDDLPTDPKDGGLYAYYINEEKKEYQLMTFMENEGDTAYITDRAYAVDYKDRTPMVKGKSLGILLDADTNEPIQEKRENVDVFTYAGDSLKAYLGNGDYLEGTGNNLQSLKQFAENGYGEPEDCPKGFIPVPGNNNFNQPGFCVAKYEMSYDGVTTINNDGNSTNTVWDTYNYGSGDKGTPVSEKGNSPIATINQTEAIAECKSMGEGYHLITNKEWMTIARNVEKQPDNWSSGSVGEGYIPNGRSNDTTMGCVGTGDNGNRADSTGIPCGNEINDRARNALVLSNGEEIRDLAGNVWEHVNKADTLNGSGYNSGQTQLGDDNQNWKEWTDSEIDDEERDEYGASKDNYNSDNGIGKVYDLNGRSNNVFLRGGDANGDIRAGVFALNLAQDAGSAHRNEGFRCAR